MVNPRLTKLFKRGPTTAAASGDSKCASVASASLDRYHLLVLLFQVDSFIVPAEVWKYSLRCPVPSLSVQAAEANCEFCREDVADGAVGAIEDEADCDGLVEPALGAAFGTVPLRLFTPPIVPPITAAMRSRAKRGNKYRFFLQSGCFFGWSRGFCQYWSGATGVCALGLCMRPFSGA